MNKYNYPKANKQNGNLHVIIGPMFSGKTSELIRLNKRALIANKKCITIKYINDVRYTEDNYIVTHDEQKLTAIISKDTTFLDSTIVLIKNLNEYDCIFIDEIQFYNDADVVCDKLANLGYHVVVCGLKADCYDNPFGKIPNLPAKADDITVLKAICKITGKDAPFTLKIDQNINYLIGKYNKNIIDLGKDDKYMAVSREGRNSKEGHKYIK